MTPHDYYIRYQYIDSTIHHIINNYTAIKGTESDASLIINKIWLGNFRVAHDRNFIIGKKIHAIVNITQDIPNKYHFVDYYNIFIRDEDACKLNINELMNNGADAIHQMLINNKNVLVHCKRGHHRSASLIVFYFMKYYQVPLLDAIIIIKNIRPTAFRRKNCIMDFLINYEILNNRG